MPKYRNSENTIEFKYRQRLSPQTEDELINIIQKAHQRGQRIKIQGGSHTFNNITTTNDTLISLEQLQDYTRIIYVDKEKKQACLGAGMQLGDAIEALNSVGLHFPSLGSWYQQTLGGVIATSVHGSSLAYGSLSDLVIEIEAILADGRKIHLKSSDDELKAWRVNLGQLGIVTKITFQLSDPFYLSCQTHDIENDQNGFDHLFELLNKWDQKTTPYLSHLWLPYFGEQGRTLTRVLQKSSATRPNEASKNYEKKWAKRDGNILLNASEDRAMYLFGKSFVRNPKRMKDLWSNAMANAFLDDHGTVDRSFRVFMYDQYREPTENHWMRMVMNAEYALDIQELETVVLKIRNLLRYNLSRGLVINFPRFHLRFAPPSDNTLLGLNKDRKTVYFGHYPSAAALHKRQIPLVKEIEKILDHHGGRPHWGKCRYLGHNNNFTQSYDGGWEQFLNYRAEVDPSGIFSDGLDMFKNINLFHTNKAFHKPFSGLNPKNYSPIRYLGGRSSDL